MKLPLYKITIDEQYSDGEDLGISAIAFTATPAIKTLGVAFQTQEKEEKKQYYADKIKNRITAPILIPMSIFRSDEYQDYYVEFTEAEIERLHSKFMKNFSNRQVFNLEHNDEDKVNAYVYETWIVQDPLKDKAYSSYGIKVPRGTVMMTAQIADKQTYDNLVENDQIGFSIEGYLGLSLSEIINKQIEKEEKMNKQKMSMPAGEYKMGNQIYTVMEDGTFSVALADDEKKEDEVKVEEEVKEEELADEVIVDEVPVDEAKPMDYPTYTKEEVDAKFDELYKMIAEMKAEEVAEEVKDEIPVQMSEQKPKIADRLYAFTQAINFHNE